MARRCDQLNEFQQDDAKDRIITGLRQDDPLSSREEIDPGALQ